MSVRAQDESRNRHRIRSRRGHPRRYKSVCDLQGQVDAAAVHSTSFGCMKLAVPST